VLSAEKGVDVGELGGDARDSVLIAARAPKGGLSCETLRLPAIRTFPWCGGVIMACRDSGPALFELDQYGP
jgi:hypothetical protein